MHSNTYTALARWADETSEVIVATYESRVKFAANTVTEAVLILHDPDRGGRGYSVMVVQYPTRDTISQEEVREVRAARREPLGHALTRFNEITRSMVVG
jgi:hypothetical protein